MNINKSIYFAGTFAGRNLKELCEERLEIVKKIEAMGIKVYDPLRDKAKLDAVAMEVAKQFSPNEIVYRDLDDINRADYVLAIFTNPSIGTSCEMMYAWDRHKMIVIVSDNPAVVEHPWVKIFATKIFPTIDEALEYMRTFLSV